jgi:nitrite reductase (NADH) small subunit
VAFPNHMDLPAPDVTDHLDWIDVCALDDIPPACGAPALLAGKQIALVRPGDGAEVYALSNYDPFSQAFVIARGIVGDRGGRPKIASPIYKQSFDLQTGVCMDDPTVSLATYPARVVDGRVQVAVVGPAPTPAPPPRTQP